MKRDDLIELRKLDIASLQKRLFELQKDLVLTKLKIKRGELTNLRAAKNIKKTIAVIKTVMTEKRLIKTLKTEESK